MSLSTRITLLGRLKEGGGSVDWELFYSKYSGAVISFARRQGCDDHTALDVLQETVMLVMRRLPGFQYDASRGRFRNWLMTIVAHKSREARRRAHLDRLVSLDAPDEDGVATMDELTSDTHATSPGELEGRWRQALIEEAIRRLLDDPRTNPETVAVFKAVAFEGRPAAEVAAQFGMKENAVYQIKNRLMTRLQALVAGLERGGLDPDPVNE